MKTLEGIPVGAVASAPPRLYSLSMLLSGASYRGSTTHVSLTIKPQDPALLILADRYGI